MEESKPDRLDNIFAMLSKVDVTEHVEQKGKFSYLSWPFAVKALRLAVPDATWEVRHFTGALGGTIPFMATECGYFVEVAVTVQGVTLSQIHPVLDYHNNPVEKPNGFDINTSIQRCLVKAIAMHGLGLHIYAGEDLPDTDGEVKKVAKKAVNKPKSLPADNPFMKPASVTGSGDPDDVKVVEVGEPDPAVVALESAKDFLELNNIYQSIPADDKADYLPHFQAAATRLKESNKDV